MNEELRTWLKEAATHPAMFGLVAAVARWALGDRAGGWKALFSYVAMSLMVAWATGFWLADEGLTPSRRNFYLILAAFVAKDVLVALVGLSTQFGSNPIAAIRRIRAAIAGGPKE